VLGARSGAQGQRDLDQHGKREWLTEGDLIDPADRHPGKEEYFFTSLIGDTQRHVIDTYVAERGRHGCSETVIGAQGGRRPRLSQREGTRPLIEHSEDRGRWLGDLDTPLIAEQEDGIWSSATSLQRGRTRGLDLVRYRARDLGSRRLPAIDPPDVSNGKSLGARMLACISQGPEQEEEPSGQRLRASRTKSQPASHGGKAAAQRNVDVVDDEP